MFQFRKSTVMPVSLTLVAAVATVALAIQDQRGNQNARDQDREKQQNTIVDVAKKTEKLKTFLDLVEIAGLTETLREKGPYTVLAPTDAAFLKMGKSVEELKQSDKKQELARLLKHHIVTERQTSRQLVDAKTVRCMLGQELKVEKKDETITIEGAKVEKADVRADNGVIHLVDKVLMPAPGDNRERGREREMD